MKPVSQTIKADGSRTFYVVSNWAGAVTFWTMPPFGGMKATYVAGRLLVPGDLGVHTAADKALDEDDARYMEGCDFTESGCLYEGFQSQYCLDILANEGEDSLFSHLTTIHHRTFKS